MGGLCKKPFAAGAAAPGDCWVACHACLHSWPKACNAIGCRQAFHKMKEGGLPVAISSSAAMAGSACRAYCKLSRRIRAGEVCVGFCRSFCLKAATSLQHCVANLHASMCWSAQPCGYHKTRKPQPLCLCTAWKMWQECCISSWCSVCREASNAYSRIQFPFHSSGPSK